PAPARTKAARPRVSMRPPAPSAKGTLEDEFALVSRAQAALSANDAATALALLDVHAARYPSGQLAEEREALRVLAACTATRADAGARAARFLRAHPRSPLAARIRRACGT